MTRRTLLKVVGSVLVSVGVSRWNLSDTVKPATAYLTERWLQYAKLTGHQPKTVLVSRALFEEFKAEQMGMVRQGVGTVTQKPPTLVFKSATLYANNHLRGRKVVLSPVEIPYLVGKNRGGSGT